MNNLNASTVLQEVTDYLNFLNESGIRAVDCSADSLAYIAHWDKPPLRLKNPLTLEQIYAAAVKCKRCRLHADRRRIVFGQGNPQADIMFIGEAPSYDEELTGQPFAGATGELLTKIIQAMTLKLDQVYICNAIKCAPPNNRNPLPDELSACAELLKNQIQAVNPRFICTLGVFAAQIILNTNLPVSQLRGRFYSYGTISVMPTYHPAALLKNPSMKKDVWEDIKKLMAASGLTTP